jgi:hypothetical protein
MNRWSILFAAVILTTSAFAGVTVVTPTNGSNVGSPVQYSATATTNTCNKGVASMGLYVNNELVYVVNGASLNKAWPLSPGKYNTVVEEWDYCGGASYTPIAITVQTQTGVWVTAPTNDGSIGSPVNYVATATTGTCQKGIASMGIYVNNVLSYVSNGASLNTNLNLTPGTYNTVVEEWDYCGGAAYTPIKVTVTGGSDPTLYNLQASAGWVGYGELPPDYDICTNCGPGVTWSMQQHVKTPSLSGNSTQFNIGGTQPYADVLFTNPLIGQNSSQGLPDKNHTLVPSLHNFTYDAYFYGTNMSLSQVMEFDVSMYFDGISLVWGNQCRIAGGNEWDIWDNVTSRWVPTGFACDPISNGWNHVTIQVQRESDNTLLFQSITLNGVVNTINQYYAPSTCPPGWWGITVNYQMDGNSKQSAYTTYLDNFSFSYW